MIKHTEQNCKVIAKILADELTDDQLLAYVRNLKRVSFLHALKKDEVFFNAQIDRLYLDDDTISF